MRALFEFAFHLLPQSREDVLGQGVHDDLVPKLIPRFDHGMRLILMTFDGLVQVFLVWM